MTLNKIVDVDAASLQESVHGCHAVQSFFKIALIQPKSFGLRTAALGVPAGPTYAIDVCGALTARSIVGAISLQTVSGDVSRVQTGISSPRGQRVIQSSVIQ
ncbi:protein of unknown function [Hyphomicrobium sp. 1Nfss2.1]